MSETKRMTVFGYDVQDGDVLVSYKDGLAIKGAGERISFVEPVGSVIRLAYDDGSALVFNPDIQVTIDREVAS